MVNDSGQEKGFYHQKTLKICVAEVYVVLILSQAFIGIYPVRVDVVISR